MRWDRHSTPASTARSAEPADNPSVRNVRHALAGAAGHRACFAAPGQSPGGDHVTLELAATFARHVLRHCRGSDSGGRPRRCRHLRHRARRCDHPDVSRRCDSSGGGAFAHLTDDGGIDASRNAALVSSPGGAAGAMALCRGRSGPIVAGPPGCIAPHPERRRIFHGWRPSAKKRFTPR